MKMNGQKRMLGEGLRQLIVGADCVERERAINEGNKKPKPRQATMRSEDPLAMRLARFFSGRKANYVATKSNY